MKYAVIASGNKQYKVAEGDIIEVQRLPQKAENSYIFTDVLLFVDDKEKLIGTPLLSQITVSAAILENKKGKKIRVAKFKAKSRYRRVMGFRPALTRLKIETISVTGKSEASEKKKEKLKK